ncbi:MAG TPA: hypothetical protein VHS97_14485, partial [Isosphaeraceae bacterium]|nr:hypothetical protein [Isosphaeraceae bacterium]
PRIASVLLGCGSPPFVTFLSLASYADIDEVVRAQETFGRLELIGIDTYESPLRVVATCLLGTAGFVVGAIWLSRAAVIRFDRAVGRPERARKPREEFVALASLRNRREFHRARQHRTGSRPLDRDAVTTGSGVSVICTTGGAEELPFRARSWRRKGMVVLCVSALMVPAIAYVIPSWREHRLLHEALAETDRLYPGWHIEDLEAARRQVPDATNGALRVLDAGRALPARWHCAGESPSDAEKNRRNAVAMLAPTLCLAPQTLQSLQTDLNEVGSALAEARALMDFSEGRFPVAWASDGVSTQLRHPATARDVVNLLAYDVLLRSQKQETDEALLTCHALLNVGRSLGDEPTAVSQRLRIDIRMTTCQQVEFALAHGRASEAGLARLQDALSSPNSFGRFPRTRLPASPCTCGASQTESSSTLWPRMAATMAATPS